MMRCLASDLNDRVEYVDRLNTHFPLFSLQVFEIMINTYPRLPTRKHPPFFVKNICNLRCFKNYRPSKMLSNS